MAIIVVESPEFVDMRPTGIFTALEPPFLPYPGCVTGW
jgi:hypothetical protein